MNGETQRDRDEDLDRNEYLDRGEKPERHGRRDVPGRYDPSEKPGPPSEEPGPHDPRHGRDAREHRLLPWTGEDGRPCYLSSDGDGLIDALADEMEEMQLGHARELLADAAELTGPGRGERPGEGELRSLAARLAESLRDVLRVAESRGGRLKD